MYSCPDTLQLQALADGQCGEPEARHLTAHLAACPACAAALAELRRACLPLHALTEAPPPALERLIHEAVRDVRPLPPLACEEALEWVSLRLDGELDHEQMQRLEGHLLACAPCYRAAAEMATASGLLRAIEPEAAPAGLLERLQAAAALAAPVARQPAPAPLLRRWGAGLAGVAAAAAIFLAVFMHALTPVTQSPLPTVAKAPPAPTVVAPGPVAPVAAVAPTTAPMTLPERAATTVTSPAPAARRTVATRTATLPTPYPASSYTVSPPRAPGAPVGPATGAALESRGPTSLAMTSPALPEITAEHPTLAALPPSRAELAPAPMPHAAPSGPARVAADLPKPTPAEVASRPAPAPTPTRSRSNWVSRPASTERDIYKSDDSSTRLADARSALARDARDVSLFRSPGLAITH